MATTCSSLLTPLRKMGIGVSQRITVSRGSSVSPWPLQVIANQALPKGTSVALLPDTAVWDVNALVDLDQDGLVPDPAAMISVMGDDYPSLDTFYMAFFLACQTYSTQPGWHADRIGDILDTFPGIAAADGLGGTLKHEAELLQRFSHDFPTPPLPTFLAAFYYTQTCCFPWTRTETDEEADSAAPNGAGHDPTHTVPTPKPVPRRLACAALVDVLPRAPAASASSQNANVALRRWSSNGESLSGWAARHKIHGARQYMKGKGEKHVFLHLETLRDVTAGESLAVHASVFAPS